MRKLVIVAAAGVFAAAPAFGAVQGDVGAYVWKGGEDTVGIGVNGHAQISGPIFVHGMFEGGERGNQDSREIRAGGGVSQSLGKTVAIWAGAELIDVDQDNGVDESGFGLFGGAAMSPVPNLWLTTQFGIADVDGVEGSEWSAGMAYAIARPFSVTLKRREAFGGAVADTQIGLSYSFGGM